MRDLLVDKHHMVTLVKDRHVWKLLFFEPNQPANLLTNLVGQAKMAEIEKVFQPKRVALRVGSHVEADDIYFAPAGNHAVYRLRGRGVTVRLVSLNIFLGVLSLVLPRCLCVFISVFFSLHLCLCLFTFLVLLTPV